MRLAFARDGHSVHQCAELSVDVPDSRSPIGCTGLVVNSWLATSSYRVKRLLGAHSGPPGPGVAPVRRRVQDRTW